MVGEEELGRRIRAARELRNLSQVELGKLLAEDGLGKHDIGRIERGELPIRRVHIDALIRHLQVPEHWFTSEDVDLIVGWPELKVDWIEAELLRQGDILERLAAAVGVQWEERAAEAAERAQRSSPGPPSA